MLDSQTWRICRIEHMKSRQASSFFNQFCIRSSKQFTIGRSRQICIQIYWFLEVLGDALWSILKSWENTLASLWWWFGARLHSGGPLSVPRLSFFFDGFWLPDWRYCWVTFLCFSWYEVAKDMCGSRAYFDVFWLANLLICDVLTFQTYCKHMWFSWDDTCFIFSGCWWYQAPLETRFCIF